MARDRSRRGRRAVDRHARRDHVPRRASRGIRFVEVPPEEFDTMGCNVLALGPRHAMMVEGNPETERRMRKAGVKIEVIAGADICRKGEGGPTCMTRPLIRG
jgi:N-dimethylarginine dimethylaminohydrolase